tara:strand:+ start:17275 stop:17517 length:243 start_codon:yes stop_codon:yes gene_type:complete
MNDRLKYQVVFFYTMDVLSGSLYAIAIVSAWRGITIMEDVMFKKEDNPIQSALLSISLAGLILLYKHEDVMKLFKPTTTK